MPISTAPAEKWSDLAALLGDCLVVHAGVEGKRPDLDALFASLSSETLTLFFCPMRMPDAERHAWIGAGHLLPDLRYEMSGSSGSLPTGCG
jgi:vanillate O-demethylase ferredoxin subunit